MNPETRDKILAKFREEIETASGNVSCWTANAILSGILNALPDDETCMTCQHRNEGDGYHGIVCSRNDDYRDCAYIAVCPNWLQEGE